MSLPQCEHKPITEWSKMLDTHDKDNKTGIYREQYRAMRYYHIAQGGFLARFHFEGDTLYLDFRHTTNLLDKEALTILSSFPIPPNELKSLLTFIDEHTNESAE